VSKSGVKRYIKGTLILIVIFGLILVSCYGIAFNGNDITRKVFYIVFFSVCGGTLVAYWIYAFISENKKKNNKDTGDFYSDKKNGK
jgi:phage shock protein PspC (stress-responsive transcriptional regulator)